MTTLPDHVVALLAEADLADDPTVASLTVGLAALADVEAPTPTGELAALLDGTVRSLRGGGGSHRRVVTTTTVTIASVVALSATTAAAVTGVRAHWPTVDGPYPRILDTRCDYAAVASVAARRAS
jgi:hypothetical protein